MLVETLPLDHEEREKAITTLDRNVFLAAGAGSGKTRVLVDRYLYLLETGYAGVPEIVAITFTEKAAREMKERIREKCFAKIMESLIPDERRKWEKHRRDLENAPISTIHSLCARLLRENPIAAGIDPEFQVLSETQRTILIRRHVQTFLLERVSGSCGEALAQLIADFGMRTLQTVFETAVSDGELCEEWGLGTLGADDLKMRWEALHARIMQERLQQVLANEDVQHAMQTVLDIKPLCQDDALASVQSDAQKHLQVLLNSEDIPKKRIQAAQALSQVAPGNRGRQGNWPSSEALDKVRKSLRLLKESLQEIKDFKDEKEEDAINASADRTAALLRELHLCYEEFRKEKRSYSVLDFDDLQLLAYQLLETHAEVRQRYQERYKQVLVDEFQDTNRLQKRIAWLLAGSEDGETIPPSGRVFMVGDAKQSIYRFRGADVTVFNETRRLFQCGSQEEVLILFTNFRAQKPLLDFFNTIFSNTAVMGTRQDIPDYATYYEPLDAFPERVPTLELPAQLQLIQPKGTQDESEEKYEDEESAPDLEALRELEGRAIAAWIQDLVTSGKKILDPADNSLRPVAYRDIAMLFRATTDLHLYERALRLEGVPYYIESGRGFYQRLEILDVLSLLQHLERPGDAFALACVLRSPCVAVSDATLYWLSRGQGLVSNYSAISAKSNTIKTEPLSRIAEPEIEKLQFAAQTLARLRAMKNRVSIPHLLEALYEHTGLTAVLLSQFNGERAVANLRRLVEVGQECEKSGILTLHDFIHHLQELTIAEERASEAPVQEEKDNVVHILTVHKAKGLEWPVVILADIGRSPTHRDPLPVLLNREFGIAVKVFGRGGKLSWPGPLRWIQKELAERETAERRRLLYVAMTRARDLLMMSSIVKAKSRRTDRSQTWLDWVTEALGVCPENSTTVGDAHGCQIKTLTPDEIADDNTRTPMRHAGRVGMMETLRKQQPVHVDTELERRVRPVPRNASFWSGLTVTQLRELFLCPYRFYLAHIEEIAELRDWSQEGADRQGFSPTNDRMIKPTDHGTVVHRILQALSLCPAGDIEAVMEASLSSVGLWMQTLRETYFEELKSVATTFLRSAARGWCDEVREQRTEYPFFFSLDNMVVQGKFDWVGGDAEQWTHLLDYKTGESRSPNRKEEYEFQIGLYCYSLDCIGQMPRKAGLYYADTGELEVFPQIGAIAQKAVAIAEQCISHLRRNEFTPRPGDPCSLCPQHWACPHSKLGASKKCAG